jgi:hypothetical protein
VVWGLDSGKVSWRALFGTSWGLCAAGLLIGLPVVWMRVHDTEVTAEDFVTEKVEAAPETIAEKDGTTATQQPKELSGDISTAEI